jgi:hypothetical protein
MVTFVSLFLWLMTENHPVQVAVDPAVASVEIYLDGESIGVATAPKWEVSCDFGKKLRPHELVAVARGGDGRELDRATQVVNLPRANAEVEIVFEGGTPDAPTDLRVIAENSLRLEPLAISVFFDNLMLAKNDDGSFALPVYDPGQVHLITAEVLFPDSISARRDITFGGTYGGRVATELTAVAVTLEKRADLTVDQIEGLFSARGEKLTVAAVDRQGGRVYVVRDHATWPLFGRSGHILDRRLKTTRRVFSRAYADGFAGQGPYEGIAPDKDKYYLVVANPTYARGLALYPVIQPFSIKRWGLPWLLTHIASPEAKVPGQRLTDAAAVAGLRAAGDGCPRIVVLVLGEGAEDTSEISPASVREYLQALRVPLVVWSTRNDEAMAPWGHVDTVKGLGSIDKLSRRLMKSLHRQWIVWIEGNHLPNEIEVAENNLGIRLAG